MVIRVHVIAGILGQFYKRQAWIYRDPCIQGKYGFEVFKVMV
jgi:hypothetical protein